MRPRQKVLRRLVSEYQLTRSKKAFEGILKRVDSLVLSVTYRLLKQFPYLKKVGFDDLYQTAIVGVGEALLTVKEEESGEKITARIVAYIKAAIRRTYKPSKEVSGGEVCKDFLEEVFSLKTKVVEVSDLIDLEDLDISTFLSKPELDLIYMRFYEGRTYPEIGREIGFKEGAARKRILKVVEKLRLRLFRDNLESENE